MSLQQKGTSPERFFMKAAGTVNHFSQLSQQIQDNFEMAGGLVFPTLIHFSQLWKPPSPLTRVLSRTPPVSRRRFDTGLAFSLSLSSIHSSSSSGEALSARSSGSPSASLCGQSLCGH